MSVSSSLHLSSIEAAGGRVGWLTAEDGIRLRYAVFPVVKPRGTFLVLPGFTEFIEKYLEPVGELTQRGFQVVVLDWRGQGKSDRALSDRHKGHVLHFDHFQADAVQLLDEVAAPLAAGGPLYALGHSMGGHNLLRLLHDRPHQFRCAIAVAPMIDVWSGHFPPWASRYIARLLAKMAPNHYVPRTGPYDPETKRFVGNPLTSDPDRFERTKDLIRGDQELALGGPTWTWLKSAFDSMDMLSSPAYAAAIHTPVLLASAGRDRIVRSPAQHRLALHMPACTLVDFPDAQHEILLERDDIRQAFWQAVDAFLAEHEGDEK
ncbi:MAG: alpha/beta hydrolase [Alphaproteobacteria bacterium]|nr:alpha/beta hydrolase [Alphaproteobacteria bacterium]